jgi:hypothetical protein
MGSLVVAIDRLASKQWEKAFLGRDRRMVEVAGRGIVS